MAGSLAWSADVVPCSSCTCSKWCRSMALSIPFRRWSGCTPTCASPAHLPDPRVRSRDRQGQREDPVDAGVRRRVGAVHVRREALLLGEADQLLLGGRRGTSANQTVWSVAR